MRRRWGPVVVALVALAACSSRSKDLPRVVPGTVPARRGTGNPVLELTRSPGMGDRPAMVSLAQAFADGTVVTEQPPLPGSTAEPVLQRFRSTRVEPAKVAALLARAEEAMHALVGAPERVGLPDVGTKTLVVRGTEVADAGGSTPSDQDPAVAKGRDDVAGVAADLLALGGGNLLPVDVIGVTGGLAPDEGSGTSTVGARPPVVVDWPLGPIGDAAGDVSCFEVEGDEAQRLLQVAAGLVDHPSWRSEGRLYDLWLLTDVPGRPACPQPAG